MYSKNSASMCYTLSPKSVRRIRPAIWVVMMSVVSIQCAPDTVDKYTPDAIPTDAKAAAVKEIANNEYSSFLNRIPKGAESDYGFSDRLEFLRVQTGTPLQMRTIDVDDTGDTPIVSDSIRSLPKWRVPLIVDGKRRALITVAETDEGLKAVAFGAAKLAGALNSFDNIAAGAEQSERFLLRVAALHHDFLAVPDADRKNRFYPVLMDSNHLTTLPVNQRSLFSTSSTSPPFLSQIGIIELITAQVKGSTP